MVSPNAASFRPALIPACVMVVCLLCACDEPEGGSGMDAQERFTVPDGRVAVGRARVMERATLPGWTPASPVRWGQRWLIADCDDAGVPDTIRLYADPSLTRATSSVTAVVETGYCAGEPALVSATTRLSESEDAVRVELLKDGRMGWVASGMLARPMEPGECEGLYAADRERLSRCRYGPPTWPADSSDTPSPGA